MTADDRAADATFKQFIGTVSYYEDIYTYI